MKFMNFLISRNCFRIFLNFYNFVLIENILKNEFISAG